MIKWYDDGPYKKLDLDLDFYLLLYFGSGDFVDFRICFKVAAGGQNLYYQDLSNTRRGQHFKEAEDLAKRYFKSITNGL